MSMDWFIHGNTWTKCTVIRKLLGGLVIFRLHGETQERQGRARPGLYGLLIEVK